MNCECRLGRLTSRIMDTCPGLYIIPETIINNPQPLLFTHNTWFFSFQKAKLTWNSHLTCLIISVIYCVKIISKLQPYHRFFYIIIENNPILLFEWFSEQITSELIVDCIAFWFNITGWQEIDYYIKKYTLITY